MLLYAVHTIYTYSSLLLCLLIVLFAVLCSFLCLSPFILNRVHFLFAYGYFVHPLPFAQREKKKGAMHVSGIATTQYEYTTIERTVRRALPFLCLSTVSSFSSIAHFHCPVFVRRALSAPVCQNALTEVKRGRPEKNEATVMYNAGNRLVSRSKTLAGRDSRLGAGAQERLFDWGGTV